jgi:hypothetical protein
MVLCVVQLPQKSIETTFRVVCLQVRVELSFCIPLALVIVDGHFTKEDMTDAKRNSHWDLADKPRIHSPNVGVKGCTDTGVDGVLWLEKT